MYLCVYLCISICACMYKYIHVFIYVCVCISHVYRHSYRYGYRIYRYIYSTFLLEVDNWGIRLHYLSGYFSCNHLTSAICGFLPLKNCTHGHNEIFEIFFRRIQTSWSPSLETKLRMIQIKFRCSVSHPLRHQQLCFPFFILC